MLQRKKKHNLMDVQSAFTFAAARRALKLVKLQMSLSRVQKQRQATAAEILHFTFLKYCVDSFTFVKGVI